MKPISYQHELAVKLENRAGVKGLKLILLKEPKLGLRQDTRAGN